MREKAREVEFETPKRSQRYKRARYSSPQLGRFISRDPIGFADGYNLYRAYFVPQGVDPFGREVKRTYNWRETGDLNFSGDPIDIVNIVLVGSTSINCVSQEPPEDCVDPECKDRCKGSITPKITFKATWMAQGVAGHGEKEFTKGQKWSLVACGNVEKLKPGQNFTGQKTLGASVETCDTGCCPNATTRKANILVTKKDKGTGRRWITITYSFSVAECGVISNEKISATIIPESKGGGEVGNHVLDQLGQ